jgi:hypothetical protein
MQSENSAVSESALDSAKNEIPLILSHSASTSNAKELALAQAEQTRKEKMHHWCETSMHEALAQSMRRHGVKFIFLSFSFVYSFVD